MNARALPKFHQLSKLPQINDTQSPLTHFRRWEYERERQGKLLLLQLFVFSSMEPWGRWATDCRNSKSV